MKVAVPLVDGSLSMHFGHCDSFAIMDMDDDGNIVSREDKVPPAHEPGVLPAWLAEQSVTHIIAGGMGSRAQDLFTSKGIGVVVGASFRPPEELATACFQGTLEAGDNICGN